jgi:hypothetical protein
VPFHILQFVLELPGNVANAPQGAGLAVLVEKIRFFGREVAFHPTDAPSMRRPLDQSIRPGAHIGPVQVPVRGRPVRFIFRFRGDLGLVFRHDGLDVIFKNVAFFFSLLVLAVGVGGSLSPAGEESIT